MCNEAILPANKLPSSTVGSASITYISTMVTHDIDWDYRQAHHSQLALELKEYS